MRKIAIITLVLAFIYFPLSKVQGESYDFYVEESAADGGTGSSSKPFDSIRDALKEAESGDVIYVRKGEYSGDLAVGSGITIQGERDSSVVIKGSVDLENKTQLKSLTVETGGKAVIAKSGTEVAIENCIIKNFGKIGINILSGDGKLVIKNSQIYGGSGKGVYVEVGNKIELSSNKIHDNGEEGLDIREKVDGSITDNEIYDNGESGIEIVLGSSDVSIEHNDIYSNGSSGIATQYYSYAGKVGNVAIEDNEIKDNKKYAIDCNVPLTSGPSSSYWGKSLDIDENELAGNGFTSINPRCGIVEIDEEDVESIEKHEEIDDADDEEEIAQATPQPQEATLKLAQKQNKIEENSNYLRGELEKIVAAYSEQKLQIEDELANLARRNKFALWYFGTKKEDWEKIKKSKIQIEKKLDEINGLIVQAGGNPAMKDLEAKKSELLEDKKVIDETIAMEENRFSAWGTMKRFFGMGFF